MAVADSASNYITIAVIVVGAVFLLLVVCGSAILFCRMRRMKRKQKSLSFMVNAKDDNSSEEPDSKPEFKQDRRNSRRSVQLDHPKETLLSTTINIEPTMMDTGTGGRAVVERDETIYQHTLDITSDLGKVKDGSAPVPRHVSFEQRSSPRESQSKLTSANPNGTLSGRKTSAQQDFRDSTFQKNGSIAVQPGIVTGSNV